MLKHSNIGNTKTRWIWMYVLSLIGHLDHQSFGRWYRRFPIYLTLWFLSRERKKSTHTTHTHVTTVKMNRCSWNSWLYCVSQMNSAKLNDYNSHMPRHFVFGTPTCSCERVLLIDSVIGRADALHTQSKHHELSRSSEMRNDEQWCLSLCSQTK